jgi:hypothetical protein
MVIFPKKMPQTNVSCHARESGYPAKFLMCLDSRLRGNDIVRPFPPFRGCAP